VQDAESNRPNGRPRTKWENNVKWVLQQHDVDGFHVAMNWSTGADTVMDSVTFGNSVTSRARTSVPRRTLLHGVTALQRRMELVEWNWGGFDQRGVSMKGPSTFG